MLTGILSLNTDALGLSLRTEYTFQRSTNETDILNVPLIMILEDDIPEIKKQYRISIKNIRAFSPDTGTLVRTDALTSIEGESINITVYDNECEYGVEPLCKNTHERLITTVRIAMHDPSCSCREIHIHPHLPPSKNFMRTLAASLAS